MHATTTFNNGYIFQIFHQGICRACDRGDAQHWCVRAHSEVLLGQGVRWPEQYTHQQPGTTGTWPPSPTPTPTPWGGAHQIPMYGQDHLRNRFLSSKLTPLGTVEACLQRISKVNRALPTRPSAVWKSTPGRTGRTLRIEGEGSTADTKSTVELSS